MAIFKYYDGTNWIELAAKSDIPTNNNQLQNGAGYITGITSSMVTNALGYTPPRSDTNYYQTPDFSSGRKISTGTGVNDLYVPAATSSELGLVYLGVIEQNSSQQFLSGTVAPQGHTHSNYLTTMKYRPISVNGTQKLDDTTSTALNLVAGDNITLSESNGSVTIKAKRIFKHTIYLHNGDMSSYYMKIIFLSSIAAPYSSSTTAKIKMFVMSLFGSQTVSSATPFHCVGFVRSYQSSTSYMACYFTKLALHYDYSNGGTSVDLDWSDELEIGRYNTYYNNTDNGYGSFTTISDTVEEI